MSNKFGKHIRKIREGKLQTDPRYSIRQVAYRIGVQPSYLSKVERGEDPVPTEQRIRALANELEEEPDVLLALAGRVSTDLLELICRRPKIMADVIRKIKTAPDDALLRLVVEVEDGQW